MRPKILLYNGIPLEPLYPTSTSRGLTVFERHIRRLHLGVRLYLDIKDKEYKPKDGTEGEVWNRV